jgi:hypothetical protein
MEAIKEETPLRRVVPHGAMAAGCGRWAPIALVWGQPKKDAGLCDAAPGISLAPRAGSVAPVPILPETEHA